MKRAGTRNVFFFTWPNLVCFDFILMFLFFSYIYIFFFNFILGGLSIGGFHTCLAFPQLC